MSGPIGSTASSAASNSYGGVSMVMLLLLCLWTVLATLQLWFLVCRAGTLMFAHFDGRDSTSIRSELSLDAYLDCSESKGECVRVLAETPAIRVEALPPRSDHGAPYQHRRTIPLALCVIAARAGLTVPWQKQCD